MFPQKGLLFILGSLIILSNKTTWQEVSVNERMQFYHLSTCWSTYQRIYHLSILVPILKLIFLPQIYSVPIFTCLHYSFLFTKQTSKNHQCYKWWWSSKAQLKRQIHSRAEWNCYHWFDEHESLVGRHRPVKEKQEGPSLVCPHWRQRRCPWETSVRWSLPSSLACCYFRSWRCQNGWKTRKWLLGLCGFAAQPCPCHS